MNFFEHQASARRQSGLLRVYFLMAVLATVLAFNTGMYFLGQLITRGLEGSWLWHEWSVQVVAGTLLIILGGSLLEFLRLRGGGRALAESLGARRIDFATQEPVERQFINVVAEMAIASGVPAPTLYVMEREQGINAFVAGLEMSDTALVVTKGALQTFDRDELQAVVGHEFSHILHGDMRLNVRLLALLAGILALGQFGGFLIRMAGHGGSRRERGAAIPFFLMVGLLLWLIGSIGLLFSRLIKAAISRQREFLADASSVQFTRNPDGLAEALLKIRHHGGHSWLDSLRAESMSHMCFGETLRFSSWFATHPPLEERIRVLGKHYLARDRARQRNALRQQQTASVVAAAQGLVQTEARGELAPLAYVHPSTLPEAGEFGLAGASAVVARAGTVNPRELASAQALYQRLPLGVRQALESCEGAQALLYALIARQGTLPGGLAQAFLRKQEPRLCDRVAELYRIMEGLDLSFSLPLTELALPRLHLMPEETQRKFVQRLQKFALLDRHLSTFEFALLMLLRRHLLAEAPARHTTVERCRPAVALVIAALLRAGGMEGEALERTFLRLMKTVFDDVPALPGPDLARLPMVAGSLRQLSGLPPKDKRRLLELAATAVLADAKLSLEEYELLRVAAALLDCPMPLLEV